MMNRKWRLWTVILLTSAIALFFAGFEAFLVFIIRPAYNRGVSWPVTLIGVVATVMIVSGYIPVPFELFKRRGRVIGIDFIFLTIDWFGAFFSLMAIGRSAPVSTGLPTDVSGKRLNILLTLRGACCMLHGEPFL